MTRPSAKADELQDVQDMIRLLNLDVTSVVEDERPDFRIVLAGGRRIGVEHTRAMNESIAAGRGARARIKAQVRQALAGAGVTAWVHFRLHEGAAAHLNTDRLALNTEVAGIIGVAKRGVVLCTDDEWHWWEKLDEDVELAPGHIESDPRRTEPNRHDLTGEGLTFVEAIGVHRSSELHVTWSTFGMGQ